MKSTLAAYLAGVLDGEGHIGIAKSKPGPERHHPGYHAKIQVRMVDRPAVFLFKENFGGSFYRETRPQPNRRQLWCFAASDSQAEAVVRRLLPHLRVKREQALNLLALRALQKQGDKYRTKVIGERSFTGMHGQIIRVQTKAFSDDFIASLEALRQKASHLNIGARPPRQEVSA